MPSRRARWTSPRTARAAARAASTDEYQPQLAQLVDAAPTGEEWLHEVKYDGYRIGARKAGKTVTLTSRNGKDWTADFPEIVEAVGKLKARSALLDGEVAILEPDGRTSFQALQNAFGGGSRAGLSYFVFDLLEQDGESLAELPCVERKQRLSALIPSPPPRIRLSEHVIGNGPEVFAQACRLKAEGIVSKRVDAPYTPGRGPTWLKVKCLHRQEFIIGGFTDPEGSRVGLGALLVGVRDEQGRLQFAGKVGTGFTHRYAKALRGELEQLAQKECPFEKRPEGWLGRHAHWVRPEKIAEVEFAEWTSDGKIRHPSFQGLREDKSPQEVVHELPSVSEPLAPPKRPQRPSDRAPRAHPPPRTAHPSVAGVRISRPDLVMFPKLGITKLELAEYAESVAPWMVPHVEGRPLTLVRCADGVGESCAFMHHSQVWAPEALERVRIPEKAKLGEYLVANTAAALVSLVQMDVVEVHTWNSKVDHLEEPDRIVIDLDPGPEVRFAEVVSLARSVRGMLEVLGLQTFVKNTGGSGLHLVVPLEPVHDWRECLAFARAVAEALVRTHPKLCTTQFAKAGRGHQILVDYLRNNRTNTSVAAFSPRTRDDAPVSTPLSWDELSGRIPPDHYTVRTIHQRLSRLREDPWAGAWGLEQRFSREALEALRQL